jgi:hypothetical protein
MISKCFGCEALASERNFFLLSPRRHRASVGGEQLADFICPKAGFPFPKKDFANAKQKSEANRKESEMGMNTII